MKLNKQILAAVLATAIAAPMVTSCGDNSNASSSDSDSITSTATGTSSTEDNNANSGEKTKISWAMWVPSAVEEVNDAETRLMEKMPNVEMDLMPFERATWQDQLNTRVAGGDIPDIIYRDSQSVVAQYAEQGVICEVPIEKAREYAPNIYEASKSYGKEVWLATYVDGKNWGLPIMQPTVSNFTNSWRMDYLEKIGVTEVPTTVEEAEQVFLKIIESDVNNSGKNDTYGMTFRGKDLSSYLFNDIFAAYGVMPGKWMVQEDGTVVNGMMKDEAKDALELLNKWYNLGIIDPEFVTTDNAVYRQKIAAGNIAYLTWGTLGMVMPPQGSAYLDALSGDPNAEWALGPALKGPNGDYGYNTWSSITSSTTFGAHLMKDEEKLNLCLQVVDFVSSNTDDAEYIRYGIEGTDWEKDETGAYVDLYVSDVNKQAQFGSKMFDSTPGVPDLQARYRRSDYDEWAKYTHDSSYTPNEDYVDWISFFTDSEVLATAGDIDPDFTVGIIDIITGVRPVSDYDVIRQEWYDKGGQIITDEYNRAYQEGRAEMENIIASIE